MITAEHQNRQEHRDSAGIEEKESGYDPERRLIRKGPGLSRYEQVVKIQQAGQKQKEGFPEEKVGLVGIPPILYEGERKESGE